jgi:hypothetical protein
LYRYVAAVAERRTVQQVTAVRDEASSLADVAAASQVRLVEAAVTLTGSVMALAMVGQYKLNSVDQ